MMGIRFSFQSPVGERAWACLNDPRLRARWAANDLDFYEGRIWRVLVQIDRLNDEIESLLHSFHRTEDFSYVSLQIEMYIISWSTLTDMAAQLINEVFDLGIPLKDVELNSILSNRHIVRTEIPVLFAEHRKALRAEEFSRLRNDIVHRSYLNEPKLSSIEQDLDQLIVGNLLRGSPGEKESHAILSRLREFLQEKKKELDSHFSSTLNFMDRLVTDLAEIMDKRYDDRTQ